MELDETVLQDLERTVGGVQPLREIIDAFAEELIGLAARATEAGAARDAKAARLALHSLASDAAMLGATALSQTWRAAEFALDRQEWAPADTCIEGAPEAVAQLVLALQTWQEHR